MVTRLYSQKDRGGRPLALCLCAFAHPGYLSPVPLSLVWKCWAKENRVGPLLIQFRLSSPHQLPVALTRMRGDLLKHLHCIAALSPGISWALHSHCHIVGVFSTQAAPQKAGVLCVWHSNESMRCEMCGLCGLGILSSGSQFQYSCKGRRGRWCTRRKAANRHWSFVRLFIWS